MDFAKSFKPSRQRCLPRPILLPDDPKGLIPTMSVQQANNPLHGVTLEQVVNRLVDYYGWDELGRRIDINCFKNDPSLKSSLKFLRKSPWARQKVEALYLVMNKSEG